MTSSCSSSSSSAVLTVGMIGCGTVGMGTLDLLSDFSSCVRFKWIVVQDTSKKREVVLPSQCELTNDWKKVVDDSEVDLVIEVMGGVGEAFQIVSKALENGKHVITANKALVSKHMDHLQDLQRKKPHTRFMYEAAVAGGIPIIAVLLRSFQCDYITKIMGIMNGTSNYILSEMENDQSKTYKEVLSDAGKKGYAEADPSADVEGYDARSKLCILSKIAFGVTVNEEEIYCNGISKVTDHDFKFARHLGYTIKLLGLAQRGEGKKAKDGNNSPSMNGDPSAINVLLSPCLVSLTDQVGKTTGVTNLIEVTSSSMGKSYFIGAGAGRGPTGNSVAADVMELHQQLKCFKNGTCTSACDYHPFGEPKMKATKVESEIEADFYVRFCVKHEIGVVHKISAAMVEHKLSFHSLFQEPVISAQVGVPLAVVIQQCRLSEVQKFCAKVHASSGISVEEPFFCPIIR